MVNDCNGVDRHFLSEYFQGGLFKNNVDACQIFAVPVRANCTMEWIEKCAELKETFAAEFDHFLLNESGLVAFNQYSCR